MENLALIAIIFGRKTAVRVLKAEAIFWLVLVIGAVSFFVGPINVPDDAATAIPQESPVSAPRCLNAECPTGSWHYENGYTRYY